jgi:hypothetical protein
MAVINSHLVIQCGENCVKERITEKKKNYLKQNWSQERK